MIPPTQSMLSRRSMISALSAFAFLSLFGCGRTEPEATPPGSGTTPGKKTEAVSGAFKVALVTPGSVSDGGWNASALAALNQIKGELGAETQNVEAKDASSQEENLRSYASKGYNIVFAHGGEFETVALKIEKDFPRTLFVIPSGRTIGTNTTPVVLNLKEGAYLAGMLAAGMSKSGKIASIGAMKSPVVEEVFKAYEDGAKAYKPTIEVIPTAYTNDWEDVGKAQQQTMALLSNGADVILQDLDQGAKGVYQAVDESSKPDKPVFAIGTNSDQNALSKNILASATIDITKAYVPIAKQVKEGTFKPNDAPYGLKSGVIGFVFNPAASAPLPADLKAKIEEAMKKIIDGTLFPANLPAKAKP